MMAGWKEEENSLSRQSGSLGRCHHELALSDWLAAPRLQPPHACNACRIHFTAPARSPVQMSKPKAPRYLPPAAQAGTLAMFYHGDPYESPPQLSPCAIPLSPLSLSPRAWPFTSPRPHDFYKASALSPPFLSRPLQPYLPSTSIAHHSTLCGPNNALIFGPFILSFSKQSLIIVLLVPPV